MGNKAASAVSSAKLAQADRYAPYEYTAAEEYLHKAREEAGYAEYQDAIEYGRKSEELANRARAIAVAKLAEQASKSSRVTPASEKEEPSSGEEIGRRRPPNAGRASARNGPSPNEPYGVDARSAVHAGKFLDGRHRACFAAGGCAGMQLKSNVREVRAIAKEARDNGAYNCAPRELALAETNVEFASARAGSRRLLPRPRPRAHRRP